MLRLIHTALGRALSLLFPEKCIECGRTDEILCEKCANKTRLQMRGRNSILYLDKLYYWGIYENEVLREALRRFKYHGIKSFAEPFSKMLAKSISLDLTKFKDDALIIPIPAHKERKRERGYNQAELICRELIKINENSFKVIKVDLVQKETE